MVSEEKAEPGTGTGRRDQNSEVPGGPKNKTNKIIVGEEI